MPEAFSTRWPLPERGSCFLNLTIVVKMKRHNKAIEELTKTKEAWYEREGKRKDRIAELRLEPNDASNDFKETNRALKLLENASMVDTQPTIHNYYEPSDKLKKYQDVTMGAVGLATGVAIIKIYGL